MENSVIHGNCFDVIEQLPAGAFEAIFVDPPYNIGIDYGGGKKADELPAEKYLSRMQGLIQLCCKRLSNTGSLWFLAPERWADHIGTLLSATLPRRNRIIWRETFGQYREDRFPPGHRHLFWHVMSPENTPFYTDDIRVPSQRMLNGDKRAAGPRIPDDVWEIPRLVGNAHERTNGHPCSLPEALLERVIRCSTAARGAILDPMCGSGTTLRVAQRLGRKYVGIEQQKSFVELIHSRLAKPIQLEMFGEVR